MNLSARSSVLRASWYMTVVFQTSSSQLAAGWMLTSMTPGSGVIWQASEARIGGREVALDANALVELLGGRLDARAEIEVVLDRLRRAAETRG